MPLGYDVRDRKLVINETKATSVRHLPRQLITDAARVHGVFPTETGVEAYRIGPRASAPVIARPTFGIGTVIEHAPDMPNGFIIITSYPRND